MQVDVNLGCRHKDHYALVAAFNEEEALVQALSVIVKN